jgi:lipoprotein-anchoring transpeptidase ErfK/SrfK
MFNYLQAVSGAMALAIVTASAPALAQYAPPGARAYVRDQPNSPGNWVADDDDDDLVPLSPRGQQPRPLMPLFFPPPPPFFLPLPPPLPPPFFATPYERRPASAYEPGLASRGYEPDAPRPPGDIDRMQRPDQVPGPGATPRPAPSNLASLPPEYQAEQGAKELPPQFKRQLVNYDTREPAGTIVIDTANTYLYLVLGSGQALRYGIGVGREGFSWAGAERVSRMAEWPDWHPPAEMIERQPYLPRFMAGGPGNPLGARALYLGKTLYRIHGTNQPSTIGSFVSSGCIRLINSDVEDLYSRVQVGARVVVLQSGRPPATAAN